MNVKSFFPVFLFLFFFSTLSALPEHEIVNVDFTQHTERSYNLQVEPFSLKKTNDGPAFFLSRPLYINLANIDPVLGFAASWRGVPCRIAFRLSKDQVNWSGWQQVNPDHHGEEDGVNYTELNFTLPDFRWVQISLIIDRGKEKTLENLRLFFTTPGPSFLFGNPSTSGSRSMADTCALPEFLERLDWCPNGTCPEDSTPTVTDVTHIVIHHSAGTNTSTDWPAIVRSIWDFHVNFRGWDDIGYNFLIDPDGIIYEGRGDEIQGAHFCGNNSGTLGICLLGTFTELTPTEPARNKLTELLAWKITSKGINPLGQSFHNSSGLTLPHILGHRDGCSTECPGDAFYPTIPALRLEVAQFIENECSFVTSSKEAIPGISVNLYPNPAGNFSQLEVSGDFRGEISLTLFDVMGRKQVLSGNFNKNSFSQFIPLDLGNMPSGMYLVEIRLDKYRFMKKVVIKK